MKGEREMVRKIEETTAEAQREERFTSLQPTYEDSVPPDRNEDGEDDWEHEG